MLSIRHMKPVGAVGLVLILVGCASTAPPSARLQEQMTRSSSAIEQAGGVGAQELAPVALRDAELKLEQAREAMTKEKYDRAFRLAQQAEVDAELAQVSALSAKAKRAAQELRESIRTLRAEITRAGGNR